jgi:hypothetical protein
MPGTVIVAVYHNAIATVSSAYVTDCERHERRLVSAGVFHSYAIDSLRSLRKRERERGQYRIAPTARNIPRR